MPKSSKDTVHNRLGRVTKRRIAALVLLLVIAAGGVFVYQWFLESTQAVITTSPGATRTVQGTVEQKQRIDEPVFAFELPANWKKVAPLNVIHTNYRYQSAKKDSENRFITIYMDNLPTSMAVNKVMPLMAQGVKVQHGTMSAQCTEFPAVAAHPDRLVAPAEWEGVKFLCDKDNSLRNIIGTAAPGAINAVKLTGATQGTHTFFITYEDHNYSPDYHIFDKMLDSFEVK